MDLTSVEVVVESIRSGGLQRYSSLSSLSTLSILSFSCGCSGMRATRAMSVRSQQRCADMTSSPSLDSSLCPLYLLKCQEACVWCVYLTAGLLLHMQCLEIACVFPGTIDCDHFQSSDQAWMNHSQDERLDVCLKDSTRLVARLGV